MIEDPEPWWHDYEPDALSRRAHWLGTLAALLLAVPLLGKVIWNALTARWWR